MVNENYTDIPMKAQSKYIAPNLQASEGIYKDLDPFISTEVRTYFDLSVTVPLPNQISVSDALIEPEAFSNLNENSTTGYINVSE